MKKILDKRNMTEADWQEYREKQFGIGGSDASIILGVNPYKSPFTLWLEMTGQVERPKLDNKFIEWGNLLEPVIRDKFRNETGFKVFQNNFVLQHDQFDWMVANLDGEVIDPAFSGRGVLEIKTANERAKKDWENGCPIHYMCQVQHYLAVTGYEYAYIAVLIGGNDFRYFLVERDDYVIDTMISAEKEFMAKVVKRIPPEIGGSELETNWLNQAFPIANEEEDILNPVLEELAAEYHFLQREIKAHQNRADEIKNKIKLEAGETKVLRGESLKISMPTIQKVTFDQKRFAAEHPELYDSYKSKVSVYRNFTISTL